MELFSKGVNNDSKGVPYKIKLPNKLMSTASLDEKLSSIARTVSTDELPIQAFRSAITSKINRFRDFIHYTSDFN